MSEEIEVDRPDGDQRLLLKNPKACGLGRGYDCCAFLISGRDGFECGRVTTMAGYLALRAEGIIPPQMNARRLPTEPYPECQIFDDGGAVRAKA